MRKNLLLTMIITGSALLVFSGCREQSQVQEPTQTTAQVSPPVKSEPNAMAPMLKFDETSLDFGKIGPGTITTKVLTFHNDGNDVLEISEISQCCGIVAKLEKTKFYPQETGTLTIEFHASGVVGTLERKPIIYSNDPVNPEFTLYVKAEIVQKVVWEPETIRLFLNEDNAACPKLKIKALDGREFAITGIRSTENCITADYNPTVKKTEHVLDLKVDKDKIPQQMSGEIDILMNHPQGDFAAIFFSVVPKYDFARKPLIVWDLMPNEPVKKTIKIINNYKEDIQIESTSSKENTVKMIDYKKLENGDCEVNIEITPPSKGDKDRINDIFYINLKGGDQLALNCMEYYKID